MSLLNEFLIFNTSPDYKVLGSVSTEPKSPHCWRNRGRGKTVLPSSFVPGSGGGGDGGEIRTPPPRARRAASVENRLAPTEEREERERTAVTLPGKV